MSEPSKKQRNTCFCIDLRSAAQRLTQLYDSALAPTGITITQLSQLNQIHVLKGPTLTALAAETELDRSTLGRNLRVMEKQGLVTLQIGRDARTRTIHLTEKGLNALRQAAPIWHQVQNELLKRLGPAGRGPFDELLTALTAPLAANA